MLKTRPYEAGRTYNSGSPAQKAARERAFRIFRLRGLYAQNYLLTGWRRKVAQWMVDLELRRLGAEPEANRQARKAKMLEQYFNERNWE